MARIYVNQYNSGVYRECLECVPGENLYEVLTRHGCSLPGAVCKGSGVCRGCLVYIVEEGLECLACRYQIKSEELHIIFQGKLAEQSILLTEYVQNDSEWKMSSNTIGQEDGKGTCHEDSKLGESEFGIAFDIGTTTIASALVNLENRRILSQIGCLNRQAEFGADVVSRIKYAYCVNPHSRAGLQKMHELVQSDIESLIQHYMEEGYSKDRIRKLIFSGNTTMLHFLMNLSVNGMSGYPFTPERLNGERYEYEGMEIIILPGKSAFVGADIVSGIQYLELGKTEEYKLLIDLGTNGELWLLNRERGVCTSTSCGPAFANSVTKGNAHGTTLLDELSKAYQEGKVDQTGLLQGEYFEKGISCGDILITQDTIRQIQLAKAAILTGIELAAYELRLPLEDIAEIHLAGGFGFYLNLDSAYTLGLFPEEFQGKVRIAGNTSLLGAIRALFHSDEMLQLPKILEESAVLDLSLNKNFQEFFLHRIQFPTR